MYQQHGFWWSFFFLRWIGCSSSYPSEPKSIMKWAKPVVIVLSYLFKLKFTFTNRSIHQRISLKIYRLILIYTDSKSQSGSMIQFLTHYHTMPNFDALKITSCGKNCEKGDIACNKQFLLFSQCFLHLRYVALIFHCKCTLKYRLQFFQFGPV